MSRTRRNRAYRRRNVHRACWLDCFVCYRRAGLTTGHAFDRLHKKQKRVWVSEIRAGVAERQTQEP